MTGSGGAGAAGDGRCDVLVLAAHPDDAEIWCGGTILDLVARGASVVLVDMTRGEMGTLGTPEQRAHEAAAAAQLLGVTARENLELPDAGLRDDADTLRAVVAALRRWQPKILLAHASQDVHPDHRAAGEVARRAFFHAGLAKFAPELGAPTRPKLLAHFLGNDFAPPSFCVDIAAHVERKAEVLSCYGSQMGEAQSGGTETHRLRRLDVHERAATRDRYFGSLCGFDAGEPFFVDGPLPLGGGLAPLLAAFSGGDTRQPRRSPGGSP